MEAILEPIDADLIAGDEKMPSLLHGRLQSRISRLLDVAYENEYSVITELDLSFATGNTRPDLCIFPKINFDWTTDELVVSIAPLTTIEILSPHQSLNSLIDRVYAKHFPAGVKSVWIILPTLKIITILLPDRSRVSFTTGLLIDPATHVQLILEEVFV